MSRAEDEAARLSRTYDFVTRRTVNGSLLRDANNALIGLGIHYEAVLEQRDQAAQEKLDLHDKVMTRAHALEVERLESRAGVLEREVAALEREIEQRKAEMHQVSQTTTAAGGLSTLSFAAPRDDLASTGRRSWCVAELEDICYRVRLGGGGDFTLIDVEDRQTSAFVPMAEIALEGLSTRQDDVEPAAESTKKRRLPWWTPFAAALTAGTSWTVVLVQVLR